MRSECMSCIISSIFAFLLTSSAIEAVGVHTKRTPTKNALPIDFIVATPVFGQVYARLASLWPESPIILRCGVYGSSSELRSNRNNLGKFVGFTTQDLV